jgi:hypothetical protein
MSILHNSFSEGNNNMMLGLDDIHELTKVGLTNLDVIIIGETIQYKDFRIDGEAVSLIITKYLSKT